MPRTPKQHTGTEATTDDLKALAGEVAELRAAVEKLTDTARVLGQILDEMRDDFAWALKKDYFRGAPGIHPLMSMPSDPLAPDFGERLNRFSADDLPDELKTPDEGQRPKRRASPNFSDLPPPRHGILGPPRP